MRSQYSHGLQLDVITSVYSSKPRARIEELMGEMVLSLGMIKGVEAGSLEALQQKNTILRAWIALHLKPGEVGEY